MKQSLIIKDESRKGSKYLNWYFTGKTRINQYCDLRGMFKRERIEDLGFLGFAVAKEEFKRFEEYVNKLEVY